MDEFVSVVVGLSLFCVVMFCAIEYEHNSKMQCAKFAMEKQYSASDIKSICWQ